MFGFKTAFYLPGVRIHFRIRDLEVYSKVEPTTEIQMPLIPPAPEAPSRANNLTRRGVFLGTLRIGAGLLWAAAAAATMEATSAQTAYASSENNNTAEGVNNVQGGSPTPVPATTPTGPNPTVLTENLKAQTRLDNDQAAGLEQPAPGWETAIDKAGQVTSAFGYVALAGTGAAYVQRLARRDALNRQKRRDEAQRRVEATLDLLLDDRILTRTSAAMDVDVFVTEPTKDAEDLGYERFHERILKRVALIFTLREFDPKRARPDPFHINLAPVFLKAYVHVMKAAGLEELAGKAAADGNWQPFYDERQKFNASDINLAGISMWGVQLPYIYMPGAKLYNAKVGPGNFSHADMRGANIAGYFEGAQFVGTRLGDQNERKRAAIFFDRKDGQELLDPIADDDEKNFREANFTGADLSYCKLAHVDFANSDFTGANLAGADFRGVYSIEDADFSRAVFATDDRKGRPVIADVTDVNFATVGSLQGIDMRRVILTPQQKADCRKKGAIVAQE